jgi:hypothetical protein
LQAVMTTIELTIGMLILIGLNALAQRWLD